MRINSTSSYDKEEKVNEGGPGRQVANHHPTAAPKCRRTVTINHYHNRNPSRITYKGRGLSISSMWLRTYSGTLMHSCRSNGALLIRWLSTLSVTSYHFTFPERDETEPEVVQRPRADVPLLVGLHILLPMQRCRLVAKTLSSHCARNSQTSWPISFIHARPMSC
jgi:hypothetical protein